MISESKKYELVMCLCVNLRVMCYMYMYISPHCPQNPVHMGLKLDSLTNECSVHFVKAFWSLMEQDAVKVHQNSPFYCTCNLLFRLTSLGMS